MRDRRKMSKQADRFWWWVVVALLAAALLVVGIQAATASGSPPPPDPAPAASPVKKKHTVTVQQAIAVGALVGTPIYCGWKRWVENDPCIDFSQWRKTSADDGRVTPATPAPEFGLNVEAAK